VITLKRHVLLHWFSTDGNVHLAVSWSTTENVDINLAFRNGDSCPESTCAFWWSLKHCCWTIMEPTQSTVYGIACASNVGSSVESSHGNRIFNDIRVSVNVIHNRNYNSIVKQNRSDLIETTSKTDHHGE
jgi:hypothetical protein